MHLIVYCIPRIILQHKLFNKHGESTSQGLGPHQIHHEGQEWASSLNIHEVPKKKCATPSQHINPQFCIFSFCLDHSVVSVNVSEKKTQWFSVQSVFGTDTEKGEKKAKLVLMLLKKGMHILWYSNSMQLVVPQGSVLVNIRQGTF